MPIIEVNGINMYYEVHGEGEPLIFANGVFANTLSWFNQTPVFSKKYKVILYDMRGQGQSDHPNGNYSFDLHVEDQKALLDKLNIKKFHHVGISYGSEVGIYFALKYPKMVESLTICSGVTYLEPYLQYITHLWRNTCSLADPMMFFYSTVPFNFNPTYVNNNQEVFEQAKERYKVLDYPAFVRLIDAFFELNIRPDQLETINIPCCIIVGEKDIIKPLHPYSELMHKHLLNSELYIIPETGHVVIWEKPTEFNSIVLKFLENQIKDTQRE